MKFLTPRWVYLYGFLLILALLSGAFYLQFLEGVNPCPLCVLQRLTIAVLGIVFLSGAVFSWKKCGQFFIGFLSLIVALLGVFLAGRQVWLQHLPPNKSTDCGVSLQYMLHVLPLDQVFEKILQGSAECSEVGWQFLRFSLAEWSLIAFVFFAVIALIQLSRFTKTTVR